jgi:hypothetical protein
MGDINHNYNNSDNGIFRLPPNYFNNNPPVQISHIPDLDLAYISNNRKVFNNPITFYNFKTIPMSYSDFKICFFEVFNNTILKK